MVKSCIRFHYVVRGSAWLSVEKADEPRVALSGGDLAVLPPGHAHALRDPPRSTTRRFEEVARCTTHSTHGVIHIDLGARGPETTFISVFAARFTELVQLNASLVADPMWELYETVRAAAERGEDLLGQAEQDLQRRIRSARAQLAAVRAEAQQ